MVPYIRKTFVALVATAKWMVIVNWKTTFDMFFALFEQTRSRTHYHQELRTRLHLARIYTGSSMTKNVTKQG